jgi:ketosteroid isomerase-like protein
MLSGMRYLLKVVSTSRQTAMRMFLGFTACSLIALLGLAIAGDDAKPKKETSVEDSIRKELQTLDEEWCLAIVKNDTEAIGRFMLDDWVIIGPDGNLIDRATFLTVTKSADLVHESMDSDNWRVRVYGDSALVTSQVKAKGKYKGQAFATHERSTSLFVRKDGHWQCALTQLTTITKK